MQETQCPKCRSSMELGFIKDQGYGANYTASWVEGAPEQSFWEVTKTRGKKHVQVATYRCTSCGFLESYAR